MVATVICRGETYKGPLSSTKASQPSYSPSSIVELEELALPLHSSHNSCILLREKREEIEIYLSTNQYLL
jgi:hypothetical protein